MKLDFNNALYIISTVIIVIPIIYFFTKSGFSFKEEKSKIIASLILGPILILLILAGIFGIDETSLKIGKLIGNFVEFIIKTIIGLFFVAIMMIIFVFIIAGNKKEIINGIKSKIVKLFSGIGRKNK